MSFTLLIDVTNLPDAIQEDKIAAIIVAVANSILSKCLQALNLTVHGRDTAP